MIGVSVYGLVYDTGDNYSSILVLNGEDPCSLILHLSQKLTPYSYHLISQPHLKPAARAEHRRSYPLFKLHPTLILIRSTSSRSLVSTILVPT